MTLDFEFELLWGRRYVWQVGCIVTTPEANMEFGWDVALVKGRGVGQSQSLRRLLNIIRHYKVNVIRAHNAATERSVLREWCEREGLEMPEVHWIDTLALARKLLPYGACLKQEELLKRFGLEQDGEAHSALPDARGCLRLFSQLMKIRHGLVPMPR